jgi:hypothetical protein
MHKTALNLGRKLDNSRVRRLGSSPRVGAPLVAALIASGVAQMPTSSVAATAPGAADHALVAGDVRASAGGQALARSRVATRPRLSISDDTVFEGDDAKFKLRLSNSSHRWVTVHFFTENGDARGGSDYEDVAGSRRFRPGTKRASISVETFRDRRDEGNQTFFLHLFRAKGATLVDSRGEATIIDRDPGPAPCQPKCPPPCEPSCPPPCEPSCPPPCEPSCPPPCEPNCPPPCEPSCPPPCQPNCPPPCEPNCPPPCEPNCPPLSGRTETSAAPWSRQVSAGPDSRIAMRGVVRT